MGRYHMLFLTLCWSLVVLALADVDLEVKRTPDTGLDPKNPPTLNNTSNLNEKPGGLNSDIDSDKVDQAKNDKDQLGGSKEGVEDSKVDERNPSEQKDVDLKGDEKKGEDGSVGKGKTKEGDQIEKKGEDGSVGKGKTKEGDQVEKKGEDGSVGKGGNKEGDQVEKKDEDGSVEKGESETKEGDQVEKKGEDGSVGKGGNKEGDQVEKKDEDGSVEKGGNKEESNERGKGDKNDGSSEGTEGSESKEAAKDVPEVLPQERKDGPHGEECDASNRCTADKDALIACLRVPGNDSPDLSLLIQNKGNNPLSVAISAPNFVQLEKRNVQLRQKEDIKVKVSITEGGTDGKIVLTAGSSNCILDFRDLPSLNPMKETDDSRKSTYISLVTKPHVIGFIVFSTLMLITVSAWTCVRFKKKHFDSNANKYQKLDMELPVSVGGKVMSEVNDEWDDNWDDNWDDEEAPMTPSMPLTPSVSSKGLASRRLSKEAWKD